MRPGFGVRLVKSCSRCGVSNSAGPGRDQGYVDTSQTPDGSGVSINTGDPVAEGDVGEIVVTSLDPEHPLIRLALGDLTAALPGHSPCGRTNMRIRGWMGRADQTTKVKGMFVRPEQVA